MARSQHVGLVRSNADINVAIENVARWHISAVRRTKVGSITQVKHIQWGWMSVENYYQLQKIHEFMPIVVEVIKGGYMLKAALWTTSVDVSVLASGTSIPFGMLLVTAALALAAVDAAEGHEDLAAFDVLCLFLPFGELWLLWHGLDTIYNLINGAVSKTQLPETVQRSLRSNIDNETIAWADSLYKSIGSIQYTTIDVPKGTGGTHHGHGGGGNQAG